LQGKNIGEVAENLLIDLKEAGIKMISEIVLTCNLHPSKIQTKSY